MIRRASRPDLPAHTTALPTESLELFETADDALAAFLELRGCRRVGLGQLLGTRVVVTHVFDDAAPKLHEHISAFRRGDGDAVGARAYARSIRELRALRVDERRRLRRRLEGLVAQAADGNG